MLSYISARVSNGTHDDQELWMRKFLDPIFRQFEHDNWRYTKWIKFVTMLLVFNGGVNFDLNVEVLMDDNVQARFIRFITEKNVEVVDFSLLDILEERVLS